MDKIKFKAKRIDNGEWVVGWVKPFNSVSYKTLERMGIYNDILCIFEVIPETVCIGTEINGVFMYSGDYDKDGNCVVWCEKCVGFEFGAIDTTTKEIFIPCHRCEGNFFFQDHIEEFEIIGNIHD